MGPFAYLRPGASIAEDAHIGTYVELKKASVGPGAKVPHLTYVGDATIGAGANIGAGTIFANYDGVAKNHTTVGEHAFVGSNTVLVAPVTDRGRRLHGGGLGDHRRGAGRGTSASPGDASTIPTAGWPATDRGHDRRTQRHGSVRTNRFEDF